MDKQFRFGFYGDDFTGSTDALEALSIGGMKTLLLLDLPDEKNMSLLDGYEAIGIAGTTRSLSKNDIRKETSRIFSWFSQFEIEHFHYKVCSTLDSSPDYGNIGVAIEEGQKHFNTPWVPILIGSPDLGRWVAFSQLFARDREDIYRLDRHPTMRQHPVTPMSEADIRIHLSGQTDQVVHGFNVVDIRKEKTARLGVLDEITGSADSGIVLFDTVDKEDLRIAGGLMRAMAKRHGPFVVGSSGVESAWVLSRENAPSVAPGEELGVSNPLLTMSGSASPKTKLQIEHARELGWKLIQLEPWTWFTDEREDRLLEEVVRTASESLDSGQDVLIYSCEGPDDPAIEKTRAMAREKTWKDPMHRIGTMQGRALRRILENTSLRRVCVAGGDTSGYVTRELGIYALEFAVSIDPGSPICRARSDNFDQLEISLKGGQVGTPKYFESIKQGQKVY